MDNKNDFLFTFSNCILFTTFTDIMNLSPSISSLNKSNRTPQYGRLTLVYYKIIKQHHTKAVKKDSGK